MPTISTTAPTKAGYTFGGWIDSNGTKYYNADGTSARTWNKTSNATLYAKWTINKVYVKYHINGGSWGGSTNSHYSFVDPYAAYDGTTSFSKSYGEKLNLANYNNPDYINFTRTNYYVPSGKEWCTKADGTGTCYNQETDYTGVGTDGDASHFCDARTSSCTVILYVNWKVKPVRVYYNRNGGSVTGTGYSLNGNWVSNDGGSSALYEIANPGGTLNLYDFSSFGLTRSGYSRVSGSEWCTKADGTGTCFDQSVNNTYNSLKTPSTDKTSYYELDLYANWTANSYTVTYENNGGSGCTTKTVTYNSTYGTLCTPTKAGYSFGGWYKETGLTNKVESSTKVATASNHKLYAKWIGNEIRIFYHSNWGTLTNSSYILSNGWIANTATDYVRDTVQEGGSLNPYNHDTFKISKTGYHTEDGKEWCTKQDGSGTCYDENGSYSYSTLKSIATDKGSYYEIDVFAHWVKDSWTRKTWTCTKGTYSSDTNFYSETCTSISQGDADANNYNYWRTCTSTSTDACRGSTNNVYNCYYVKQYKRDGCETWAEPPTVETGLTTCEESNDFRIYVGCY